MNSIEPIEHVYKDNFIIEFSKDDFMATYLNIDEDVIARDFNSLEEAEKWINKYTTLD